MNAFDVDYWISVMYKYSWTPRTLDEKSQHALMYLFQKKRDLEKRLQSYGATLEEAIPNYLQAVMDREDKNT